MTPEEMELARSLLATVQNTTAQSWDILVRGTVISNAINLVTILISILISFIVSYLSYRNDDSSDACTNAFLVFVSAGFICLVVVYLIIGGALLGIYAPEYVIANDIINRVGGN